MKLWTVITQREGNPGITARSAQMEYTGRGNHDVLAPATYQIHGRQYIVVPATGVLHLGTPRGDAWVAFALKDFRRRPH